MFFLNFFYEFPISVIFSSISFSHFPDSHEIYYSGKNIFLYHAKIKSFNDMFKNRSISRLPIKLTEFDDLNDRFELIKTGDEFFVVLNKSRKILYIWSHDLTHPSIFYRTDGNEIVKYVECGKHSTVIVTRKSL